MRFVSVVDYSLDLIGGAQRAALNQAAALVATGHEVRLVAPRPRRPVAPPGVEPHWIDGPRIPGIDFAPFADGADLRARLGGIVRGADAVLLHSEFGLAVAAQDAARRFGAPVVHTVHTAYWPRVPAVLAPAVRAGLRRLAGPAPLRLRNALLERTVAVAVAADVVVSPSGHQADDLGALGVPGIVVLPNCGDGSAHAPEPLPVGPLHVAWIGRLVPEKRILPFLAAVRIAARRLPPGALAVSVAGTGPLLPMARAAAAGLKDVRLLGRLDAVGVRAVLASAHVSALTSDGFDNQPMTVVESVLAGRGVLFTDPRLHEGLDAAGILAPSPGPRGIADLLVALTDDPARVRSAAAGARRAARLFSPEHHLAGLLAAAGLTDRDDPRRRPDGPGRRRAERDVPADRV